MGKSYSTGRDAVRSAAAIAATALLLAACAPMPQPTEPRAGTGEPVTPMGPVIDRGSDRETDPLVADPLLQPLREALARGDWVAASLALPVPSGADPDPATTAWLNYYQLRIARLRGDMDAAGKLRDALDNAELPVQLHSELDALALRDAQLRGDAQALADAAYRLFSAGGHDDLTPAQCERLLWDAVQAPGVVSSGAPWDSWQTLATAAGLADGAQAVEAIARWLEAHPQHPARERAQTLLNAALADAALARPALLLPLSGPLAAAGSALTSGVSAAYFAGDHQAQEILVIDSRRFNQIEEGYKSALEAGADAVLGPLGKRQVGELLRAGYTDVPLLALNRPELPVAASPQALQLSLAPEDEATLVARRAFAAGARRALILRPEGEWGTRMEAALLSGWQPLGGGTVARATYGNAATYSTALQSALQLDTSSARQRDLRRLFTEPVESVGQRRRDVDVIFLLARNSAEARALKPLINYHYAGDLMVYALSTADDGVDDARDRDLNGVRLPVMPWRLGDTPPGLELDDPGSFAALHALGVDAWEMALRANRLAAGAGLRYSGHTALLRPGAGGVLERELPIAEFDGGALRPR